MTRQEAIKSLQNIVEYWTVRPTEQEAARLAIAALRAQEEAEKNPLLSPCDLCKYNPPSSFDGKPCAICPAEQMGLTQENDL